MSRSDGSAAWLVDRSSRGTVVNGTAAQRDWPFPLPESFDVDVASLSALRLVDRGVSVSAVGNAVIAALGANALGKLALAMSAGPVAFWLPLLASTLAAAGAGFAVLAAMG